jgi:CRP-like cAMP-binding protein
MLSPRGYWQAKVLTLSQICVGIAAVLGVVGMATRQPILMLAFMTAQGLLVLGVVLFAVVAATAQRAMSRERYAAGDVIVRAGDPRGDVYVVSAGAVERVVRDPDGTERVEARLGVGEHFGETALLGHGSFQYTFRAATPVVVMRMTPDAFLTLCASLPGFKEHFKDILADHLQKLDAPRR